MLARSSSRPRYDFMVLNLIAQVFPVRRQRRAVGSKGGSLIPLRDRLCDPLTPRWASVTPAVLPWKSGYAAIL